MKSYARHQKTVALSSAEAELHALVAASSEFMDMIGLMNDMGWPATGEIYSDSNASLGIAQRQGAGKARHVRTQALWVQEVRSEGRLHYRKVWGIRNPADIFNKVYQAGPLMD